MTKASTLLDEYFGLIFKAIKADTSIERAIAFIKRMLHICLVNDVGYVAASLVIICEILRARNDIRIALFGQFSNSSNTLENKSENVKLN
jgi:hypothetical protein